MDVSSAMAEIARLKEVEVDELRFGIDYTFWVTPQPTIKALPVQLPEHQAGFEPEPTPEPEPVPKTPKSRRSRKRAKKKNK